MAPADIWPSAIWVGKTSASAARSTMPSWLTKKLSEMLTRLCIATFSTLGADRTRMVGTIGPSSIICRRCAGLMQRYLTPTPRIAREVISWGYQPSFPTQLGRCPRSGRRGHESYVCP